MQMKKPFMLQGAARLAFVASGEERGAGVVIGNESRIRMQCAGEEQLKLKRLIRIDAFAAQVRLALQLLKQLAVDAFGGKGRTFHSASPAIGLSADDASPDISPTSD